jgi:hypothetical protein
MQHWLYKKKSLSNRYSQQVIRQDIKSFLLIKHQAAAKTRTLDYISAIISIEKGHGGTMNHGSKPSPCILFPGNISREDFTSPKTLFRFGMMGLKCWEESGWRRMERRWGEVSISGLGGDTRIYQTLPFLLPRSRSDVVWERKYDFILWQELVLILRSQGRKLRR